MVMFLVFTRINVAFFLCENSSPHIMKESKTPERLLKLCFPLEVVDNFLSQRECSWGAKVEDPRSVTA